MGPLIRGLEIDLGDQLDAKAGPMYVSGKLPTYPSPNLTLILSSRFGQNVRLGEGWVGNFPETYIDPKSACYVHMPGDIFDIFFFFEWTDSYFDDDRFH